MCADFFYSDFYFSLLRFRRHGLLSRPLSLPCGSKLGNTFEVTIRRRLVKWSPSAAVPKHRIACGAAQCIERNFVSAVRAIRHKQRLGSTAPGARMIAIPVRLFARHFRSVGYVDTSRSSPPLTSHASGAAELQSTRVIAVSYFSGSAP